MLHRFASRATHSGADTLDREINRSLASFFKLQFRFEMVALLQRLFQSDEHDMIAGRLKSDRLSRFDFDARRHCTHLHHALVHTHFMNLESVRNIRYTTGQTIGRTPHVGNGKITTTDGRAFWRRSRPGSRNFQIADNNVVRSSRHARAYCENESDHENESNHPDLRIPNAPDDLYPEPGGLQWCVGRIGSGAVID